MGPKLHDELFETVFYKPRTTENAPGTTFRAPRATETALKYATTHLKRYFKQNYTQARVAPKFKRTLELEQAQRPDPLGLRSLVSQGWGPVPEPSARVDSKTRADHSGTTSALGASSRRQLWLIMKHHQFSRSISDHFQNPNVFDGIPEELE